MGASGELGVGLLANAVMKVRCTNCCELYIYCVQSGAWSDSILGVHVYELV